MLIDEEKVWAQNRLIKEGKLVSEIFNDHNAMILEMNWIESLKSKTKSMKVEIKGSYSTSIPCTCRILVGLYHRYFHGP